MTSAPILPYIPESRTIQHVPSENEFIQKAKEQAFKFSLDSAVQTGSVLVKNGLVIGKGANGSIFHTENGCERARLKIPTGQGYDLCEGCHPKNHSERRAILNAEEAGHDTHESELYLWGHWWCCKPCWDAMLSAGVGNVYLMDGAHNIFNKPRYKVYVSGALTHSNSHNPDNLRVMYEKLGNAIEEAGLTPFLPHLILDPLHHYDKLNPHEVYNRDRAHVLTSKVVIAYLGEPSLGTGIELEIARQKNIPIIGFAESGRRVSHMARGVPGMLEMIYFNDMEDLISNIKNQISKL